MKIKICGISHFTDVPALNEVHPDFIGFVFAPSKRQVTLEKALQLRAMIDSSIPSVGVFVNASPAYIKQLLDLDVISYVQLHGQEDDEMVQLIQSFHAPVIKALPYNAQLIDSHTDYLLFDNVKPGSGQAYDYSCITSNKPYFLAGGINLENLDEALASDAYCLDVSSGVETNGRKDANKIKEIVRRVRQ